MTNRPSHDDLETAAVRGADSLCLQKIAPHLKPVVKMTASEYRELLPDGKTVFIGETVYLRTDLVSEDEVWEAIRSGNDSKILGYPERVEKERMIDVAVSKQGRLLVDLDEMRREAETGNVIWACEGLPVEALRKAKDIATYLKNKEE